MAAIGWLTNGLTDANNYFLEQRLVSTAWDALTVVSGGKDEKTAVLKMAYDRIRFSADFAGLIPTNPTAVQLEKLQVAQCETAYYLAVHLRDEDVRIGLQAQGVTAAGIVQESYGAAGAVPLPPIVIQLMSEFSSAQNASPFYAIDIDRREDEGVNTNVVWLDDSEY